MAEWQNTAVEIIINNIDVLTSKNIPEGSDKEKRAEELA